MSSEIHAHAVLNLLKECPMSEPELRHAVSNEFGQDVRFRTCKLSGFDLDALLAFFIKRDKIVQSEGKWHVNAARVCNH